MRGHHPFGPSRLYLYALCPGAYLLQEVLQPERVSTPASEEGERGHLLVDRHFSKGPSVPAARNLDVPPELQELVDKCIAYGEAVAGALTDPKQYSEVTLTLKSTGGEEILFGTADLVTIGRPEAGGPLMSVVADWKFGRASLNHKAISVQLAAYGAMSLSDNAAAEAVQVRVYQPRFEREYQRQYVRADLPALTEAIVGVIARAKALPMTLKPSDDACPYCPCLAQCPAARTAASELVAPEAPKLDLAGLEAVRLAELKGKVEYATGQLDALKKSVNAEIQARHRIGEAIPGWRVSFRRGRRKIPAPTLAYQRAGLDLDVFMDAVDVSPTKLEGLYIEAHRRREDKPTLKTLKAEFEQAMGDAVERAPEYPVIQKE